MPDPTPPNPTDPPASATPPAPDALAVLKAELDALKTNYASEKQARETAEAAKTALEREKMTETERVAAELAEAKEQVKTLQPLRDELGRYSNTLETLYTQELAGIPEALRPNVESLSKNGDWPARLEALRAASSLIPHAQPPMGPMGGPTTPPARPNLTAPPAFNPKSPPRLGSVLK